MLDAVRWWLTMVDDGGRLLTMVASATATKAFLSWSILTVAALDEHTVGPP